MRVYIGLAVFCCLIVCAFAAETATVKVTTTVEEECSKLVKGNRSKDENCDSCVGNGKCFFCLTDGKCRAYPVNHIFPTPADCKPDMGSARWGTCSVNFKAVIITLGVLAGVILFVIPCCIYCLCCNQRRMSLRTRVKLQKEERKWQQEEQARKAKHAEKNVQKMLNSGYIQRIKAEARRLSSKRFSSIQRKDKVAKVKSAYDVSKEIAIQKSKNRLAEKSVERATEESVGKATEKSVGSATEESVGKATEKSVGRATEESVGSATEESVGKATEKSVGRATEESAGSATEESVGRATEESAGSATEESVGKSVKDQKLQIEPEPELEPEWKMPAGGEAEEIRRDSSEIRSGVQTDGSESQ